MSQTNSGQSKSSRDRKNTQPKAKAEETRHGKAAAPEKAPANKASVAKAPITKVGGTSSMRQMRNVFEAILKYGHDEDFAPSADSDFFPTEAPAGSKEKLDVLAERVLRGEPLWHPEDRPDYSGLTGAVRPRE